jgi:xanthine dehydrogenase YagS FAD-binding subunit
VSVAAALEMEGGTIRSARIALGGVAHKPWRVPDAEALLNGERPTEENFRRVADAYLEGAQGYRHNAFKIELAKRAISRALAQAVKMERGGDKHLHRTTTEPR